MTIWEKVIVNIEKGSKRIMAGAALFSERVRVEIAVARLRIRMDDVKSLIREQEQIIGRKLINLKNSDELPKTTELLMTDEEIVTALAELTSRERDLEDIRNEIENEQAVFKEAHKPEENNA